MIIMSPYFSTRRIITCASCLWLVMNLYFIKLYVDSVNLCVETIAKSRKVEISRTDRPAQLNQSTFLVSRKRFTSRPVRHPELGTYSKSYPYYEEASRENSPEDEKFDLEILVFSIDKGYARGEEFTFMCSDDEIFVCYAGGDISEVTSDYDVIIFAGDILNDRVWDFLTENRDPRQLWMFASDVGPMKSTYIMPPDGLSSARFNMSFTHHSMSEMSYSYGEFFSFTENRTFTNVTHPFDEYRDLIAWNSEDCGDVAWDRLGFVEDLSRYLPIDSYGECGNLTCKGHHNHRDSPGSPECKRVLRGYKFVLALEDGCCSELVSDHFWNVLHYYESIPVVVGPSKADYKRVAPPNSFIFAGDFSTIPELAAYIQKVASNRDIYDAFFKWKETGFVKLMSKKQSEINHSASYCRMTDYLRDKYDRNDHTQHFESRVQPYGPFWRGGCHQCSSYDLLKQYER